MKLNTGFEIASSSLPFQPPHLPQSLCDSWESTGHFCNSLQLHLTTIRGAHIFFWMTSVYITLVKVITRCPWLDHSVLRYFCAIWWWHFRTYVVYHFQIYFFNKESYLYILPISSKTVTGDNLPPTLSVSLSHIHIFPETHQFYIALSSNLMNAMSFIHQKISISTVIAPNHLTDVHT